MLQVLQLVYCSRLNLLRLSLRTFRQHTAAVDASGFTVDSRYNGPACDAATRQLAATLLGTMLVLPVQAVALPESHAVGWLSEKAGSSC